MTYRTYREMRGLGDALTPAQISYLLKQVHVHQGNPAVMANLASAPCLNADWLQVAGACFLGGTPTGMNDLEFYSACMALASAGIFSKLGCPGDAPAAVAQWPACLTPAELGELIPFTDYCRSNPTFQGPDKILNFTCWGASRYPALYEKMMNPVPCAAATSSGSGQRPPPVLRDPAAILDTASRGSEVVSEAGPVDIAMEETPAVEETPDYSAMMTEEEMLRDEGAMPGSTCASRGPKYTTDPVTGECVEKKEGMSTATMAMIGIGGVLAVGLGYMLLKKR